MLPLIGITCGWEEEKQWHKLHHEYVCAVKKAGGIPFLLPSIAKRELITVYYRQMDGFVFSGGSDLDPFYYDEEPHRDLAEIAPRRDFFEIELAKLVLSGDKPAVGICRGLQLFNVAAGGTLHQDLKGVTELKHNQEAPRWHPTHQVWIESESEFGQIVGQKSFAVTSFHHQGINKLGKGFRAVARSKDNLIEAIEMGKRIIAVQWHPECLGMENEVSLAIFKHLVDYAEGVKGG